MSEAEKKEIAISSFPMVQVYILCILEHSSVNKKKGLWKERIMDILSKPKTTILDNLFRLKDKKMLDCFQLYTGKVGRPKRYWFITNMGKEWLAVLKTRYPNLPEYQF